MRASERWLLAIVCRNPAAGSVKTRLIPAMGVEGARTLYQAFLRDLADRFSGQRYDLLWAYTPEGGLPAPDLTPGNTLAQQGPDLGHRLLHLFQWACEAAYRRVVVVSSDVPHLPRRIVDEAFQALSTADVVLAPSDDGGYHLVGLRQPHDIFTMVAMSTPDVLAQTSAAAAASCLSLHLLEQDFDVDLPDDLVRLIHRLQRDPALRQTHTAQHLRDLQWPPLRTGDAYTLDRD